MSSVVVAGVSAGLAAAGGIASGAATAVIIASAVTTFIVSLTTSLVAKSRYSDTSTYDSEVQGKQTIIQSPVASVKMLYGEAVVSGVLVYSGTSGDSSEFLHLVLAIAGHEVEEISTVFFDEKPSYHEDISAYVSYTVHTGGDFQLADASLLEWFGEWSVDHRLRGSAYVHAIIKRNDEVFPRVPNIKALVRGKKVVDTRIENYDKKTVLPIDNTKEITFEEIPYVFSTPGVAVSSDIRLDNLGIEISCEIRDMQTTTDRVVFWGDLDYVAGGTTPFSSGCVWYDGTAKTINVRMSSRENAEELVSMGLVEMPTATGEVVEIATSSSFFEVGTPANQYAGNVTTPTATDANWNPATLASLLHYGQYARRSLISADATNKSIYKGDVDDMTIDTLIHQYNPGVVGINFTVIQLLNGQDDDDNIRIQWVGNTNKIEMICDVANSQGPVVTVGTTAYIPYRLTVSMVVVASATPNRKSLEIEVTTYDINGLNEATFSTTYTDGYNELVMYGACNRYYYIDQQYNKTRINGSGFPYSGVVQTTKDIVKVGFYPRSSKLVIVHNDRLEEFDVSGDMKFYSKSITQKDDVSFNFAQASIGEFNSSNDIDIVKFGDVVENDTIPNYGTNGDVAISSGSSFNLIDVDFAEYHRVWSKNAGLNIFDYMTDTRYGFSIEYADMNIAEWEYAYDICGIVNIDAENPCPVSRYTVDGVVDTKQKIGNNLSQMLSGCGGVTVWSDGKFSLVVASQAIPVMTIDSSINQGAVIHRCVNSKATVFNAVKSVFVSAWQNWQSAETPIFRDDEAITKDGGEVLQELDLPYTDNLFTAQRLAITNLNLSRLEGGLVLFCSHEAFSLKAMQVVVVDIPEAGINSEMFRVAEWTMHPTTGEEVGGIEVTLNEYSDDAYDIPDDEIIGPNDIPDDPIDDALIAPVTGFVAVSDASTVDTTTGLARVFLSWDISQNVRAVGYTVTASISGRLSYTYEVAGRLVYLKVDQQPLVGETVFYSIVVNRNDGLKSEAVNITHVVSDGSGGITEPAGFEIINIEAHNGLAIWTENPSVEIEGSALRVGESWRLSHFLGSSVFPPLNTEVSGIADMVYYLANYDNGFVYSLPDSTTAEPNPDWFTPAYNWGLYRFSEQGYTFAYQSSSVVHYTGAIVPASGKIASAQGFETFDIFVEEPDDSFLDLRAFSITETAQEIWISGLAFSTLSPIGYPDRGIRHAQIQLVYRVLNNITEEWGDHIPFGIENTIYTAQPGDFLISIGIQNNSAEQVGFSTDIILRVGSNRPKE